MTTNIYKDIEFSMDEIEETIVNGIQGIRGENWAIKNIITYKDRDHKAKIDYYAFDPLTLDIFPHQFKLNNKIYIAKNIDKNNYRFKKADKNEVDMAKKSMNILQKFIQRGDAIPIGTRFVKITDNSQIYDLLFDSSKTYNYLDVDNPFFNYSKEYDGLTDEIIAFAENKRLSKKLTK